jgi:hypothetical protein
LTVGALGEGAGEDEGDGEGVGLGTEDGLVAPSDDALGETEEEPLLGCDSNLTRELELLEGRSPEPKEPNII